MAITVALPTNGNGNSAVDGTSFTTGSISFVNGRVYVIGFRLARTGATPDTTVTVVGATSGTWSNVGGRSFNPSGAAQRSRVYVRYYVATSSFSETLTIGNPLSATHLNCGWVIAEISGADTAAAIPYAANSVAGSADAATSATLALAPFGNAGNLSLGVFASDGAGFTAGGSGAILAQNTVEAERVGIWYYVGDEDPSVTMTSSDWGGAALEIAALVTGGGGSLPTNFFTRDV